MLIGKRIKDLRLAKGLNQQQLGDLLGVTKVSICGYETGSRTPSIEIFCLLADIFGTSTDYLLGREVLVYSKENGEYLGKISRDDIDIIKELKNNPKIYEKILIDKKRYISLIHKKML